MARILIVIGLVVLAAIGLWALWPGLEPAHEPSGDGARAATRPAMQPATQPAMQLATQSSAAIAGAERHLAESEGPFAAVQVVAFATGAPIAGAEVRYQPREFDWSALPPAKASELSQLGRNLETLLERIGRSVTTDAQGRCRVPLPATSGTGIVARAGELFGQSYLRADQQGELRLALRPDHTLRVRVVDGKGFGVAGMQVLVRASSTAEGAVWQLVTDAEGRSEQCHVQTFCGEAARCEAQITADPPGGPGPAVAVDLAAPPPEVVLQLPPTGSVTVRVLEADGTPVDPRYLEEPEVRIAAFEHRPKDRNEELDGLNRRASAAPIGPDGLATFAHVGLGRWLVAEVGHFYTTVLEGPTFEKPHVEASIQRHADGALFVGRLLGPDGAALGKREFRLAYRRERDSGSAGMRTNVDGRFRCYLDTYPVGKDTISSIGPSVREREERMAAVLPARAVRAGVNDLGDVRLQAYRVLMAGRAVRDAGVGDASVQMEVERQDAVHGWTQDYELRIEWPQRDRFELRGVLPEGSPLRLVVREGPWQTVPPIECKVGDTDLVLALHAAASVSATFLVDEQTPVQILLYHLRRTEPPEKLDPRAQMLQRLQLRGIGMVPGKDGKVARTWSGLGAGIYSLTVSCPGVEQAVAVVEGLRLEHGTCADPRLLAIDLRGRVQVLHVRATDAEGKPVSDRNAFVVACHGDDWYGYNLGRGVAEVVVHGPVDLAVVVPGCRIARLTAVTGDSTVELERAAQARIKVALPQPLPEGMALTLQLEPADLPARGNVQLDTGRGMGSRQFLTETAAVGADGVATIEVRMPGVHRVSGMLDQRYLYGFEPRTLDLAAGGGSAEVKIAEKELNDTLRRLRK